VVCVCVCVCVGCVYVCVVCVCVCVCGVCMCVCVLCLCVVCVCGVCDRQLLAIAGHTVPGLRFVTWLGTHRSSVSVKVLRKYTIVDVNGNSKLEEIKSQ